MIDKSKLKDTMGRPLTQGLFLEFNYDTTYAVYSLLDEDNDFRGTLYPSLKKLYLAEDDPTEYTFAKKHLLGWKHWQRMNENKMLKEHFDEWREELEIKLRSDAIRTIIDMTADGSNYQAAKFMADRGWDKRGAGRPSKSEIDRSKRVNERISNDFDLDAERMNVIDLEAKRK